MKQRVIALMNQKGGVGKTTSTINLAHVFAKKGNKVLVIDLDSQRNLSCSLATDEDGLELDTSSANIVHVLTKELVIQDVIYNTRIDNLDIVPATNQLSEIPIFDMDKTILKEVIDELTYYDYILLDTPPSISDITIIALIASTDVLIPLEFSKYGVEGIYGMSKSISISKDYNPSLNILGLFGNRSKKRNAVAQVVRASLPDTYRLLKSEIPESADVNKAHIMNQTIFEFNANHVVSKSYFDLANEITKSFAKSKDKELQLA